MSELRDLLAQIVKQNAARGTLPSSQHSAQLANSILSSQVVEPFESGPVAHEDPRGPSPVNRILDLLSRPLYAGMNLTKQDTEEFARRKQEIEDGRSPEFSDLLPPVRNPQESLSRIWEGLSGKAKVTGSDLLEDTGMEPGIGRAAAGLGLDILGDPLTYTGFGIAGNVGRSTAKSAQALKTAEDITGAASRDLASDISKRAASAVEELNVPKTPESRPPAPSIPSRGQVQEPPRTFMAGSGAADITPNFDLPALPAGPTKAIAAPSDTIATPVPTPRNSKELIDEVSGIGINWRRMAERQIKSIPENADRMTAIRVLEAQQAATRSPVFKNMIGVQLRKLREGITPANMIESARRNPVEFPKMDLSATRRRTASTMAEGFLKTNKYDEINHVGQTNLFNRIQNWVNKQKLPEKAKPSIIYQMLRVAEDKILETGKKLVDAEGYPARLSDIATLAGGAKSLTPKLVDDFRKARPLQEVEDLKAFNTQATAQNIIDPILKTAQGAVSSAQAAWMPPSRTVQLGSDLSRELANIAREAGASSKEAQAAKKFIQELFDPSGDAAYSVAKQEARELIRQTATGKVNAQLINRLNDKVYKSLDANPKVLGNKLFQTKVVEGIMTRFATWWGAKDLRPFAKQYIDTARNVAAAFEKSLTPIIRSTTGSQREKAWKVAQGRAVAGNPDEAALAQRFQFLVENIMGVHGIKNVDSVVTRSGTTMKDINKELPSDMRFIDSKGRDPFGREYNYRDGDWTESWKEWNIKEPSEVLYKLTRAMQIATRKNAMLDDAAARWGVPVKGGSYQSTVKIDRLQGMYFPKPIAEQLQNTWNRLEKDAFFAGGKFLQLVDKIQRMWKTGVTIYSPSHHIRNLNGDLYLAALDGVVTPSPYRKAVQVMHAHKGNYKDIENVTRIMDADLRDLAIKARPGNVVVTTKAGHKLTADQIYQAAESQGFLLRAGALEDLLGGESAYGTFGTKFTPFGGRVHGAATWTSETRDHFVRLAHFIDVLSKSKSKSLRDAIEIAGRRVKKWHPDGSDLTGFEQNIMRRVIPFYSWLRKATPLVLEGVAMRPHVSLLFPKAMANAQEITGVESQGPGNPFPMDQMFPDWIKEKGIGPMVPPPDHPLSGIGRQQTWRGDAPGYVVINPTNPLIDQLSELSNPKKAAMSGLTPYLRVPGELLTGHTSLGVPLEEVEGGTTGHILQQVPPVGIGARVTGLTRPDEPWHPEQLTNWLVSGGLITGTGPHRSTAQFEIREHLADLGRKAREDMK